MKERYPLTSAYLKPAEDHPKTNPNAYRNEHSAVPKTEGVPQAVIPVSIDAKQPRRFHFQQLVLTSVAGMKAATFDGGVARRHEGARKSARLPPPVETRSLVEIEPLVSGGDERTRVSAVFKRGAGGPVIDVGQAERDPSKPSAPRRRRRAPIFHEQPREVVHSVGRRTPEEVVNEETEVEVEGARGGFSWRCW